MTFSYIDVIVNKACDIFQSNLTGGPIYETNHLPNYGMPVRTLRPDRLQKNGPTIMGNDGATYEQVVDKDGNPVTDPSGNPVVIAPKGTDASGNEQEDATQSLTIPYLASSGKTIESPGYRVDIPKDWEMKSSAADPILENKEETLQISIMDKSAVAKNRKEYAETARNSLMQVGNTPSEITETTIAGNSASKFTSSVQKDDDTKLFSVSTLWK